MRCRPFRPQPPPTAPLLPFPLTAPATVPSPNQPPRPTVPPPASRAVLTPRAPSPCAGPPPLVLSGHAASLTPY